MAAELVRNGENVLRASELLTLLRLPALIRAKSAFLGNMRMWP